jgi:hypothetical protein
MQGTTNLAYVRPEAPNDGAGVTSVGGTVLRFTAAAALNVGDAVFVSAANTVNKSATTADYQKFAGVVVGGTNTYMGCCSSTTDVGVSAADANEEVLVQVNGRVYVVAAAAITVATLLTVATTAGRVDDAAGATQGQIIGIALQAAGAAADKIQMLISHM